MRFKSRPIRSGAREDGDERRLRLIDAASRLFAEHGYEQTSTRQIAAAADSNISAIRYYFGDKAGLFAAVMEAAIARLADGGAHPVVVERPEPRDALRDWITWVLRTGRRRQRADDVTIRLAMQAMMVRGPAARTLANRLGAPVRSNILSLIDQLCGPGLDPDVREHAFVFIFSLCSQFAHGHDALANMGIATPEDDEQLAVLAERLTDFVIGGLHVMTQAAARRKKRR